MNSKRKFVEKLLEQLQDTRRDPFNDEGQRKSSLRSHFRVFDLPSYHTI